jgi:hypothetical protein
MAVTVFASGDQTAVIGTEHELPGNDNINEAGIFVFEVDTREMVAGDIVELRVTGHLGASDSDVHGFFQAYYGAQDPDADGVLKSSVPFPAALVEADERICTLKQTHGTAGRVFAWRIIKISE